MTTEVEEVEVKVDKPVETTKDSWRDRKGKKDFEGKDYKKLSQSEMWFKDGFSGGNEKEEWFSAGKKGWSATEWESEGDSHHHKKGKKDWDKKDWKKEKKDWDKKDWKDKKDWHKKDWNKEEWKGKKDSKKEGCPWMKKWKKEEQEDDWEKGNTKGGVGNNAQRGGVGNNEIGRASCRERV